MRRLTDRLQKLEAAAPVVVVACHRLIQDLGMTRDEAIDAYGRERIARGDSIIVRRIVEPGAGTHGTVR